MALLETEAGKQRLLTVEFPAIEAYNRDRAPDFRIRVRPERNSLVLNYRLKPAHNLFELQTRLPADYPAVSPETRVLTPLKVCPHLLPGQVICMWRQLSQRAANRWDPAKYSVAFVVQAAWRWLACYEVWYSSGEWPLPEAG